MPRVPKWLGNTVEKVFAGQFRQVIVTETAYLDRDLKRIRFEGDLKSTRFVPGNVIEFRVSDTEYRHYTPSYYDSENGICDVIFYLHDKGPGSKWADLLETGTQVKIMGPGGRLRYNERSKHHFLFGDETSLGLFQCLKEVVQENDQEYFCVAELEKNNRSWASLAGLSAEVVSKSDEHPAREAIAILTEIKQYKSECWDAWRKATFYLTGRAKSIQAFRNALVTSGVSRSQILTQPYWAEGKYGL
ncbi:hypothetical protein DYBT9275_05608 [Dyadobacter sp. CECT 9275]|uniref:FAD-binding FR-type domain-containing protein n=1 Tax=Dyadobacter helix TaxID=2822344 RepID=A0A916JGK2_9BACT|nr:siderophore-interacting protein [Dyadobacter sp. CECT 9275]CAG5016684.1 hypothetical protein DYBT9275_05608 [Dyadobacter sp. CECT 9275]